MRLFLSADHTGITSFIMREYTFWSMVGTLCRFGAICFCFFGLTTIEVVAQIPDMSGFWTINVISNFGPKSVATGEITQSGNTFYATLELSGNTCDTSGDLTGVIQSGNKLSMSLKEDGQYVSLNGTVAADGNSATGTFSAPPFGCTQGDSGSWSGLKNPSKLPRPVISSVVNSATGAIGIVPRQGFGSIFGQNFSSGAFSFSTGYASEINNTQVQRCTNALIKQQCSILPVLFVSPTQVNFYNDWNADDRIFDIYITNNSLADTSSVTGPAASFKSVAYSPSSFSAGYDCDFNKSGCELSRDKSALNTIVRPVISDSSGKLVYSNRPANIGGTYVAWVTGLGGPIAGKPSQVNGPIVTVEMTNGGPDFSFRSVRVLYAGYSPQFLGLAQINFTVDASALAGSATCRGVNIESGFRICQGGACTTGLAIPVLVKNGGVPCQ